jgi:hypothetical protein
MEQLRRGQVGHYHSTSFNVAMPMPFGTLALRLLVKPFLVPVLESEIPRVILVVDCPCCAGTRASFSDAVMVDIVHVVRVTGIATGHDVVSRVLGYAVMPETPGMGKDRMGQMLNRGVHLKGMLYWKMTWDTHASRIRDDGADFAVFSAALDAFVAVLVEDGKVLEHFSIIRGHIVLWRHSLKFVRPVLQSSSMKFVHV